MSPDSTSDSAQRAPLLRSIENYYDETWFDFRVFWMNDKNRALHLGWWDDQATNHADSLVRLNQVLAERAGITATDQVLDAGCGVGGSSLWLAETIGAEVWGITISGEQVLRANRYARDRELSERVHFDRQDFCATTFLDASFDVVWAVESFCHAADKPAFLREVMRLLRPGGRLVMHDYIEVDGANPSSRGRAQLQAWLDGWVMPSLVTVKQLEEWSAAAGFAAIAVEDASAHVERSLRRLYRMTLPFSPFLSWFHRRGWRSDAQHGNTLASLAQYRAYRRGLWHPAIVLAHKG